MIQRHGVRYLACGIALAVAGLSAASAWGVGAQVGRAHGPDKYHDAEGNPIPEKNEHVRMAEGADSPDEAMRWVLLAERDENGDIAPNGIMHARGQVDAMVASQTAAAVAAGAVSGAAAPVGGISPLTWTWIGPGNIGGRTRAIAVHPTSPSIIFVGSVGGGIWRTTDSGTTWAIVNDFMANLAVTSIVFQPGNPSVMFAATGEGFNNQDAIRGAGIFKSVDGGNTWTQLSATAPTTINQNFIFVNRLAFSDDGTTLLAASNTGLWRSTDLGATWSNRLSASLKDVKFIPGSSANAVTAGRLHDAYYSSDGGLTWAVCATGLTGGSATRVELAVSASQPQNVYAQVEVTSGNSQIWKSTDFGVNYTMVSAAVNILSTQGWYDNVLWIDPTNDSHIIAGGVSLYRSTDGGLNFTSLGSGCHSDEHAIVSDPGFDGVSNKRVYIGSDGGLCKLENVSVASFTNLNHNYGVTQFYGGSSVTSGKIFGGTQDNGSLLYTPASGPQAWTSMIGGDGGFVSGDQYDANYMYGEFQWMMVHRSSNGLSSSRIDGCSPVKAAPYQLTDACAQSSASTNFIAPILLDPNNSNRLLAGGANLWRTDDARTANTSTTGPSWAIVKPTVGSNISAIAVVNGNSDAVWIGHNNGNVYVTADGTSASPTWTQVDSPSVGLTLPNRAVTSIAVDPVDANTVYVSFGGFSSGNVWVTHDNGGSWADATGGVGARLPDAPVRSVAVHPTQAGWIYAGTDVGVFASQTGGATWTVSQEGPSNVAVFQLFFTGTKIVAVTHGRGMFTAETLPSNPASGAELITNGNFSSGTTGWSVFEAPDIVHNSASNGVFEYHRANPLTTASQQAVVFQATGQGVAAFSPLVAQFDLGNNDAVRKRISVLMLDADFSDLSVCTFWLPALSSMHTYQMRTHPTRNWASASIYFYAASTGTGNYLLDNVSMKYTPAQASDRTECVDPLAPGAGASASGNLLVDGDFSSGALGAWGTFGTITSQIVSGVFDFIRPTSVAPAGVVLQGTGQPMAANDVVTATFQLANSSTVRKRVTVLLHDNDFSDLSACTFWMPPGQALSSYTMRTYATKAWTNATMSVYAATVGTESWIRFDNASMQRTAGTVPLGTECIEPVIGPAAFQGGVAAAAPRTALAAAHDERRPGALGTGGFATSDSPASGRGGGWRAEAWTSGRAILEWASAVDLTGATSAHLTFASQFASRGSTGEVQVSLDGVTWQTVATVPAMSGWLDMDVDLGAFAGRTIYLRFVFDGAAPATGANPDTWIVGDVQLGLTTTQLRRSRSPL